MRAIPILLVCVAATCAAGCTEVDEHLVLDGKQGGTWHLRIRWNADLWRRAAAHLPETAQAKLEGHPFPLREAQWRDALEGLDGVELVSLESGSDGAGWRRLEVEVAFRHLRDLLRLEPFARRSLSIGIEREGASGPRIATLEMDPIPFVPVLDPVAALLAAEAAPPPEARGPRSHRDPPPLERFGLERDAAQALWKWVGPLVAKARFTFRVTVPGVLRRVGGEPADGQDAHCAFGFDTLRDADADRRVRLAWRVRRLDDPEPVAHTGEERARIVESVRGR